MKFPEFSVVRFGRFQSNDHTAQRLMNHADDFGPNAGYYELEFYYVDGTGGLTIEGVHFPARRGFFTCCKPGQRRKMVLPHECYFFNIATQDPTLQAALDQLPTYGPMAETEQILALCSAMFQERQRNELCGILLVEGCICAVLSILFRNTYSFANVADCKVYRHQSALLAANEYLRNHLQDDVNLKQLAHDSGLHPTYFHKLFTAAFGKTPSEQLMIHRLQAALSILVSEDLSISEVSARCGFSTPNYFCHKFRKQIGMTPNQYRKASRKRRTDKSK
ncbi:MAG: helix-turn-helix transcriptional regulator [Oscillospiraceae bacterium]|nr:helix-turn-helix transcriptional regulator [Oscillospiraceae bacterium]